MAIDAIAAKVNAGRIIDIPNGTGFCLYITRECLDAVGLLSEDFYRGYVEDVDFCLHARAKGISQCLRAIDLCRPRRKQIVWPGKAGVGGSQLRGVGPSISNLSSRNSRL